MYYTKKEYKNMLKRKMDFKLLLKNMGFSFLGGGIICVLGQIIITILTDLFDINQQDAQSYMIGIMIVLSAILSGFGIYDKLGQIFKCGTIIPITGFTNSVVSSCMEYKPEGFILGIGANALKLAGSVITLGVISAYIVGLFRYLVRLI